MKTIQPYNKKISIKLFYNQKYLFNEFLTLTNSNLYNLIHITKKVKPKNDAKDEKNTKKLLVIQSQNAATLNY